MIIYMRKGVNRIITEHAAVVFQRRGCEVHIKNGDGKFILAVIGDENVSLDGITGIEKVKTSDEFFLSNRQLFVDAREFFRD